MSARHARGPGNVGRKKWSGKKLQPNTGTAEIKLPPIIKFDPRTEEAKILFKEEWNPGIRNRPATNDRWVAFRQEHAHDQCYRVMKTIFTTGSAHE